MISTHTRQIGSYIIALAMAMFASISSGQLPTHQLHTVTPLGSQRGQSLQITVGGPDMVDVRELVFSDPNLKAQLVPGAVDPLTELSQPQWGNFNLTIPAEQPPGVYEVWAVGRYGVSNPRRFVIDSLPTIPEAGTNTTLAAAQAIAKPQALFGKCDPAVIDYYKIDLTEGETITIDCWAKAVDSRLAPMITIQNGIGKDLVVQRGSETRDPRLQFTAPTTGSYYLTVRDFLLDGGGNSFYWLRVQPGIGIDELTPSAAVAATSIDWKTFGYLSKPGTAPSKNEISSGNAAVPESASTWWKHPRLPFLKPAQATVPTFEVLAADGTAHHIAWAPPGTKIYADIAGSTQVKEATPIELPAEITGRLPSQAQDLYFKFNAEKGAKLFVDVGASRLGDNSDPIVAVGRIIDAEQPISWFATLDDPANREASRRAEYDLLSDDPSGEIAIPETGSYVIRLRNQYRSLAGMLPRYRLGIRAATPDFQIFAAVKQLKRGGDQQTPLSSLNLVRGNSLPVHVLIQRRDGFSGTIDVKVDQLPAGVTASPLIIPGGRSDGWLLLNAAADAAPGLGSLSIIGQTLDNNPQFTRQATPLVVAWDSPDRNNTPAVFRVSSQLLLAVTEEPLRVSLTASSEKPVNEQGRIIAAPGEELKINFQVKRDGGFAGEVKAKQQGLPDPWGAPEITLAPDATQTTWTVKIPAENSAGIYNFYFRGDLAIPFQVNPQQIPFLTQSKDKLVQKQQMAQQEKDAATAAGNQEQITAADGKLTEINNRITQIDKQIEEANKGNAVQNKDIALWTNSFVLEVKAPTP